MAQAKAQADTFRNAFVGAEPLQGEVQRDRLAAVLDDDFNTPDALALFHEWRSGGATASLRWGLDLFGLGSLADQEEAPAEIAELARRRQAARSERDFGEADRLRAELDAAGWEVRDVGDGFQLVRR
jgi:cysteinyl-tRNA synthetase